MGQNGSENGTPFGKAQVPSGCSCFKGYFGDIKAKSGYLVGNGGGGKPVALLPGGRRAAFESTNHPILVTSIFFCGLFFEGRV